MSNTKSIASRVKALANEGFTDAEIDKILAVDNVKTTSTYADKNEHNQQVDETLQFLKLDTLLGVIVALGFIVILFWPETNVSDSVPRAITWVFICLPAMLLRTWFFGFKKANYFLKG